jgi:predicted transport protein
VEQERLESEAASLASSGAARTFQFVALRRMQKNSYLHLNPEACPNIDGFTRDVREINHWGTGNLELTVRTADDVEREKPFIEKAYR